MSNPDSIKIDSVEASVRPSGAAGEGSKHTLGLEAIGCLVRTSMVQDGDRPRGILIAECLDSFGRPHSDEAKANARLFAASSDLQDSTNALLFVVRALAKELGIDPETTEFRFTANGQSIANITLAAAYEHAESALSKASGVPA